MRKARVVHYAAKAQPKGRHDVGNATSLYWMSFHSQSHASSINLGAVAWHEASYLPEEPIAGKRHDGICGGENQ